MRRDAGAIPQHQIAVRGCGLMGKEHPDQRVQCLYALLRVRGKEAWYVAEKLSRQNRQRRVAAELGDAADKVDTADVALTVVPDIVEDYERSVGPAAEDRMIELERLYGGVDIFSPESRVRVAVDRLVR